MNPGIYPNTSRADYDAVKALNQSTIKKFMPNPWAWKQGLKPFEDTDSTIHGRLVEAYLFGDQDALDSFEIFDKHIAAELLAAAKERGHKGGFSKNLKEYQTWKKQQGEAGLTLIDHSAAWEAKLAASRCHEDPNIAEFLSHPELETNIMLVWNDPETGLLCKGLVDCHLRPDTHLCDVKTSVAVMGRNLEDAARKFRYQCLEKGYDIQAGCYLDGWWHASTQCEEIGPGNFNAKIGWRFIVSGNETPYPAAAFTMDERDIEAGRDKWHAGLRLWKTCHETGVFPGLTSQLGGWMTLERENFQP